jgi:hypothetical protein
LYPTVLIGVCPGPSMPCRAGTLPALVILSGFLLLVSVVGFLSSQKAPAATRGASR